MLTPTTKTEAIQQLRTKNPWISATAAETLFSVFPLEAYPILLENIKQEILSDLNKIPAQYVTSWDNGETIVTSNCSVNILTRHVTITGERHVESANPDITLDNVDDTIEWLDRAYITVLGIEFPICSYNDAEKTDVHTFYYND